MKRHEVWRERYRQNRDLDHLSPDELSERMHDCINNTRTRTDAGKLSILSMESQFARDWMVLFTEVLEECRLRGFDYPGPIRLGSHRRSFEHSLDPIPSMEAALVERTLKGPFLLKFGERKWLKRALNEGRIRICPASYYKDEAHNHARQDAELERALRPNPAGVNYKGHEHHTVRAKSDYYLYSLAASYSPRMFGDFGSSACLLIENPGLFLDRMTGAIRERLPDWDTEPRTVSYYDPVRANPASIRVEEHKPFKHAYQAELRVVSRPPGIEGALQPFEIDVGPLHDCGSVIDLESHPALEAPRDPADDPERHFGTVAQDGATVNPLPNVREMKGIALYKDARNPRDWYFEVQYTDPGGHWNQFRIPMPQAVYLMELLQVADDEQHLSFRRDAGNAKGW